MQCKWDDTEAQWFHIQQHLDHQAGAVNTYVAVFQAASYCALLDFISKCSTKPEVICIKLHLERPCKCLREGFRPLGPSETCKTCNNCKQSATEWQPLAPTVVIACYLPVL